MTTPDPITTAREAVKSIFNDADYGPNPDDLAKITVALDYAEKLKAERDEAIKTRDSQRKKRWVAAKAARSNAEGIKALTSQLEQAERVIKPFANCLFGGSPGHVHFSAASQWIKDRQAKGEG